MQLQLFSYLFPKLSAPFLSQALLISLGCVLVITSIMPGAAQAATQSNANTWATNNPNNYTLELQRRTVDIGDTIRVNFETPNNSDNERDWIGAYRIDANDRSYLAYRYTNENADGTVTFNARGAGEYEFRYFKNDTYNAVAKTRTLTIRGGGSGDNGSERNNQCEVPQRQLNQIENYPPPNGNVIAFGDSLTYGTGATAGNDYVSELEQLTDVQIRNEGVPGDTTRDALDRLESDVLSQDPSVVLLWIGGNDFLGRLYQQAQDQLSDSQSARLRDILIDINGSVPEQNISEDQTFSNIRTIIERIQDEGAVVVLIGFSGGIFDNDLEQRYERVANQTGSLYVPDVLDDITGRPSRMSDLVHPDNDGYELVAERVERVFACTI